MPTLDCNKILDSFSDAVIGADVTGRIIYANAAASHLTGRSRQELIGQLLTLLMPDRLRAAHDAGFHRYLATRQPRLIGRPVRVAALHKDGTEVEIELTLSHIVDEGEDLFIASLRDMSNQVELERQLTVTRYLRAATHAAAKLTSHLNLEGVLQTVVQTLVEDFEAALARVWLYHPDTHTLHLQASAGLSTATTTSKRAVIDLETYPYKVGEVARSRNPYIKNGLLGDSQFDQEWVKTEGLRSVAAFPILIGDELLGVFVYFSCHELYPEISEILSAFASMIASSIHDVRLLERERKAAAEAEAAQAAAEDVWKKFHHILESIQDGFITLDHEWRFRYYNRTAQKFIPLLGLQDEAMIPDVSFWDALPELRGTKVEEEFRRAVRENVTARFEKYYSPFEGWLEVRAYPSSDGLSIFITDVTDRKRAEEALRKSEERLQLATRAAGIGTFDWHIPSGEVVWSEQELRLFGLEPGDFDGNLSAWVERVLPDDLDMMRTQMNEAMAAGQPEMDFLFRIRRPDAAIRWIEGSARFLYAEDGSPERMVGVNLDITERRELEDELRATAEELVVLNRRKDEFMAMLAHELRNPLAPIRNALHLLRLQEGDRDASRPVREILERQTHHLSRLVDDLLEVSRITSGKIDLRPERLDLARLCQQVVEDYRNALEIEGLTLECRVPQAPVWVQGDATRLSEVLGNLLDNARKFTDRGGRVIVRLETQPGRGPALLSVRDTGIGIEPDLQLHLFETFYQADQSLDRGKGGLGLGLPIIKGLVELHGGNVSVFSEGAGHGSEFVISLPLETQSSSEASPTPPPLPSSQKSSLRVLIIEDNRDAAETLRLLLEMFGHHVTLAFEGYEGIERAKNCSPDVVICDIGLPGLDGFKVAQALRQFPSTVNARLIAVTGYGREEDVRKSREAGFNDHLTKPVDPDTLLSRLAVLNEPRTP